MAYHSTVADGDKRCVRNRRNKSSEFSDSGSDDNQAKNPDSKNENISRRKRKLLPADMQASVEEQVAEVVDVSCGKKKERIPRRNNKQPNKNIVEEPEMVINNQTRRVESLDGATPPTREESSVTELYYKGIHLKTMRAILEAIVGESSCGRVRVALSDYAAKLSVVRDMCDRLLICSTEADFVQFLKLEGENATKFMFYYAGRDNLSACINADGYCSLRNALVLAMGFIPEVANEGEKDIVRNRDIDLTNPVGSYEMTSFISDLLVKLNSDSILLTKDHEIRERFVRQLTGMKRYLADQLPGVLSNNCRPFLHDTSLWLDPLCIPIISAYRGFKCTVFETTKKFIPTTEMTTKGLRWWLALHAGDGVDSYRFHQVFTYRECSDIISQQARFCTTGVSGRETQASSNRGPILCHYYPIPTHDSDMSDALDEAVASMAAEALHKNKELMLIRFECIF